ncbi:DUF3083 family protein [Shewanella maritima]|uniref:DUF3083 family protein n=1 Tax=Shewanella maritima TaxID=2520507 RepID=UPI0037353460
MSVSRQKKVYLPTTTRKNQYITVGFPLTDEFLAQYSSLEDCYQAFAKLVFQLAEKHELYNVHVVTTDKLPVVRYHAEAYCFSTEEQLRFFYNPAHHEAQRVHAKADYRAKKLKVVFLATGNELRSQSASFHKKVKDFTQALIPQLPVEIVAPKIRDHQHLSYDFFAKNKGNKETYGYKLGKLDSRYERRDCQLPEDVSSLNYALVSLPISRSIKEQIFKPGEIDHSDSYQSLCDKFIQAAKSKQLNKLAVFTNGKVPLVRNSKYEQLQDTNEFQMVGFDPNDTEVEPICQWQGDEVAEVLRFVIVAGKENVVDQGYGRFMNQVEETLRKFVGDFELDKQNMDLIVRFHQHLSYKC